MLKVDLCRCNCYMYMPYIEIAPRSLLCDQSVIMSCPLTRLPSVWKFSIRPVLWQSCFLQRMSVVRNYWHELRVKTLKLCSGGSSLAEVLSLGTGIGERPVALTWVCRTRLVVKLAGGRASLATMALAMLTSKGNCPAAPSHPVNLQSGFPHRCWLILLVCLRGVLAVLSVPCLAVLSPVLAPGMGRCSSASSSCWDEGAAVTWSRFQDCWETRVLLTLGSLTVEIKSGCSFLKITFSISTWSGNWSLQA